jgi:DNA-binding transcriptional regulator YiaG
MGKMEGIIRIEMVRLAKREVNRVSVPLKREVRSLKKTASQFRKTIQELKQFADHQQKQLEQKKAQLSATPEEIKRARFSPRLIRAIRKRLDLSQRQLATLSGVTVGAVHQWEMGKFAPKDEKKGILVALRKLGRREARRLLSLKTIQLSPKRSKRRRSRRKRRK